MIEKEIAASIRRHEASLKHWRAVKAATAKLRGTSVARTVRKGVEQMARTRTRKRSVKQPGGAVKAVTSAQRRAWIAARDKHTRAMAADRTPRTKGSKPTVGKLIAGTK